MTKIKPLKIQHKPKKELVLIYEREKDWYVKCTPEQAEAAHKKINEVRARLQKEIAEEKARGIVHKNVASEDDIIRALEAI